MLAQSVSKKKLFIILGLLLPALALFFVKFRAEREAVRRVMEDLALYEPFLTLEQAEAEVSLLSGRVDVSNVLYSLPDLPGANLKIARLSGLGVDRSTILGNPEEETNADKLVMEGLELTLPDLEKPVLEWGYYEVNDLVLPYRELRRILRERKEARLSAGDRQDLASTLSTLIPLAGRLRSGKEELRNIRLNLMQLAEFDLSVASLESSGQRALDPAKHSGFDLVMDDLRMRNLTVRYNDWSGGEHNSSLGEFRMRGFKMRYQAVLDALSKLCAGFDESEDAMRLLGDFISAAGDYSLDRLEYRDLSIDFMFGLLTIESLEAGQRSLREQGPAVLRNLRVSVMQAERFSLEEIGLDRIVLPEKLVALMRDLGGALGSPSSLEHELSEQPYTFLQGLKVENFYLKNANFMQEARLEHWRTDIDLGERAGLKSNLSNLFLSQQNLRFLRSLLLSELDLDLGSTLEEAGAKGGGLSFNAGLNLDMLIAELLECTTTFAADSQPLGEFKFAMEGSAAKDPSGGYGPVFLRKLELFLRDSGFLDAFFTGKAAEFRSREAAKRHYVETVAAEPNDTPGVATLRNAVRDFVDKGGSLRVTIHNPKRPLQVEDMVDALERGDVDISAKHSNP